MAEPRNERRDVSIDRVQLQTLRDVPILTVVTAAFNSERTIERTIQSILGQTYRYIEYIIIDGGSTDRTLEIIDKYRSSIAFVRSGRDGGISQAFNLGIEASTGRYVTFVNSDDWMSPGQAAIAVNALESTNADFVFGKLAMHAADGSELYTVDGSPVYWKNIKYRMPHINHPTVVVRRTAYEKVGPFDPRVRVAMDFDWHMRAEQQGVRGVYAPALLGHMSTGGICDTQWRRGLEEVREIAIRHGHSKFLAHAFYMTRVIRAYGRIGLQRVAPAAFVNALHRVVNPRYRPVRR